MKMTVLWDISPWLIALTMETVGIYETSINFYDTTRRNIPQKTFNFRNRSREILKIWIRQPQLCSCAKSGNVPRPWLRGESSHISYWTQMFTFWIRSVYLCVCGSTPGGRTRIRCAVFSVSYSLWQMACPWRCWLKKLFFSWRSYGDWRSLFLSVVFHSVVLGPWINFRGYEATGKRCEEESKIKMRRNKEVNNLDRDRMRDK